VARQIYFFPRFFSFMARMRIRRRNRAASPGDNTSATMRQRIYRRVNLLRVGAALLLMLVPMVSPVRAGSQDSPSGKTMQAGGRDENDAGSSRAKFVGDGACLSCHKEEGSTYLHTAHHLTSQLATHDSMPRALSKSPAVLTIADPAASAAEPGLYFKIEAKADGSYYETAFTGWRPNLQSRSERIDIITGSGTRGQTYLYWEGDRLFELPVSYWAKSQEWINSPGYLNGSADFSRPVNPGCMECHSTYLRPLSADPLSNRYDKASLMAGISCEVCHGAGADHVALQRSAPAQSSAEQAILNPAKISRDRQIELCALCHNGIQREELAPAFSYVPGEPLGNYFKPIPADPVEHPDVHGNQVGLLQRSRCYLESPKMSCSTCHNVHARERTTAYYSERCMSCHRWQSCGVAARLGSKTVDQCIECHMPVEPTSVIVSETAGKVVRATMRNHWIKVYPEAHLP
jgi:hypothetical protein